MSESLNSSSSVFSRSSGNLKPIALDSEINESVTTRRAEEVDDIIAEVDFSLLLKSPRDVIAFIEKYGVIELGSYKIDDSVAIRAFSDKAMLTLGNEERDIDWKKLWFRELEKYRQKGSLIEAGWQEQMTIEAHVVSIKHAAGPPETGLIQPILKRWKSKACPLSVFALPAVQAVLAYKWESWAGKTLLCEFILHIAWLLCYTIFIILFHHEDPEGFMDKSLIEVWHMNCVGVIKILLNFICPILMLPFIIIEFNTMYDYGLSWLSYWNIIDIIIYICQILTCVFYTSRKYLFTDYYSIILAMQCICLFSKVQYFSRVFASAKSSLVDTLGVVLIDVAWFLLFIILTIFSFSLSFFILFRQHPNIDYFNKLLHAVFTLFSFMLGGFEVDVFYAENGPSAAITIPFFVAYESIMSIVLLNLLIAIMTDSYSKVMEDEHLWNLCSKAQIIDELETTMPRWLLEKWNPPYIHILKLRPKSSINLNRLWDRLDMTESRLVSSNKEMSMKLESMEERITKRLDILTHEIKLLEENKKRGIGKLIPLFE